MEDLVNEIYEHLPHRHEETDLRDLIENWLLDGNDNGDPVPDLALRFDGTVEPSRETE